MPLKGARIVPKGDKPRYQDRDVWEKSSDVRIFSLFDQDWQTIEEEGLSYLFNESETEFERRKAERLNE